MKLLIAGGREFTNSAAMLNEINNLEGHLLPVNGQGIELVCGMARGADITAYHLFYNAGFPVHCFPAEWDKYGKRAGYMRNAQMADVADLLIAFWDGKSRGTKNMIEEMIRRNKPYHIVYYQA